MISVYFHSFAFDEPLSSGSLLSLDSLILFLDPESTKKTFARPSFFLVNRMLYIRANFSAGHRPAAFQFLFTANFLLSAYSSSPVL